MPALQPYIIEAIWEQFSALLPERKTNHPLGCRRPRIPDRVVFEKLVEVLVFGGAYWRIVDEECSATSLRRRRDEWIKTRVMDDLWEMALETYDRLLGLELADLAVDCCITKAPCGGEKAGKSPVDRGKRGIKRSRRVKRATISTTTRCGCLTGAEAATSSGVLLPSTRAFGHVPLTGEVDKSRGMERAPVAQEEDTNELFADQQPRCEIGKSLTAEGECQRLGEVQVYGSLLCMAHAELLRLGQRSETLLGEVFQMDQWLESAHGQVDELRIRRAEHHRNELVEQLRFNRTRINLICDELSKDKGRTT